jgi:hypothetical protein
MLNTHILAADALLVFHALLVGFVVLGVPVVLVGGLRGWHWVRNPWIRLAHLLAITVVVMQAWAGRICPLTRWENALRRQGGGSAYPDTFISHWLARVLYHDLPDWVFIAAYSGFALLVLATWWWIPPRFRRDSN